MTTINQLSSIDELSSGDKVPVYDESNGDPRKASLAQILAWVQSNLTIGSLKTVQLTPPVAPGFSVTLESNSHTILTAAAGFTSGGAITLPPAPVDKDEVLFTSNQLISSFTFTPGAGKTVQGAPTSLSANGFFRLKYDETYQVWIRVG